MTKDRSPSISASCSRNRLRGRLDRRLADLSGRLGPLVPEVCDLAETCRDLSEHFEADPARLDEVEKRLELLRRLEAKYHKPLDELIAYREGLDRQEIELQSQENDLVRSRPNCAASSKQ